MLKNRIGIKQLEAIAELIPSPVYWSDIDHAILGGNELAVSAIGAVSIHEMVGKTPYDLHTEELAESIIRHNKEVMLQEKTLVHEEIIQDLKTGESRHFTISKSPLHCEDGKIIGVIGVFIEVTAQKNAKAFKEESLKKATVLKYLDLLASSFPVPVYWVDLNSAALGANQWVMNEIGLANFEAALGKTPYDLYPHDLAERIVTHNKMIMRTGQMMSQEETIMNTKGEIKHYSAFKAPLRDEDGRVIGVLGTSIDITAEKLAEKIRLENEAFKIAAEEQEKHRKIVDQVAHDIRSPLASMLMILQASEGMPEMERIALRSAAIKISDITNNLLSSYKKKDDKDHKTANVEETREPTLISPAILQLLTEKKYQYQASLTKFEHHFTQDGNFAWVNVQPTEFHRALSNIINNAVDAFDGSPGTVIVRLDGNEKKISVTVEDTGKGMSAELIQKIKNRITVTEGKQNGHGIGLTQVRDTLERNEGQMQIDSQPGVGTRITLTFPRAAPGKWIAESINLNDDDTVVILDDDTSIHDAWDTRFNKLTETYPDLLIKHFEMGQDTIDYINGLSPEHKCKVFLLTDYELLKQGMHGLDVIAQTGIKRSILVTSHYVNRKIRHDAIKIETLILPKQLAHDIPISITHPASTKPSAGVLKNLDVVFIDDDQSLLAAYDFTYGRRKKIELHHEPGTFINMLSAYPKNTKIMLDYQFDNYPQNGIEIASYLHDQGFSRLYLMTGMSFAYGEVADYLTLVHKTDVEQVEAILNK